MQQFTQKYTIVQLFEDIPEGAEFSSSSWPLHSTIADTFAIDWGVQTMVKELTSLLASHAQATATVLDDTFFSPDKQVQVALLEMNEGLVKLHYDVVSLLEKGGAKFNDPLFTREGFLAHSTVQKHARLNKGDIVRFNSLSIVDMFPNNDPYRRKILKTINISRKH
jgi:hypothetical protein